MRSERGSGTVLAVALIGCLMAVTLAVVPLYRVLAIRQAVAGAADAAALAAADVAAGYAAGYPCEMAEHVASANNSRLDSCTVDGLIATVTTAREFAGFSVTSTATAGPPPGEAD